MKAKEPVSAQFPGPILDPQLLAWPAKPFSDLVHLLAHRADHRPGDNAFTWLLDGEFQADAWSYERLWIETRRVAAALLQKGAPGDRVLLLFSAGAEFVPAFFGCLAAGMLAVPAYLPRRNRNLDRLKAVVEDAGATMVLTTEVGCGALKSGFAKVESLAQMEWIASDGLKLPPAPRFSLPQISPEQVAFLQYTSGSTGNPKGVMVTHANLLHNSALMYGAMGHHAQSHMVSWLPLFHDLGLILGLLQPIYGGFPCTLMAPNAFLQKPRRWLDAISRVKATTTASPNFGFELAVQKIPIEERHGLDLSSLRCALNGAEPVRAGTLKAFEEAFAPFGYNPAAMFPAYGMAEATLVISGGPAGEHPTVQSMDEHAYASRRVGFDSTGKGKPLVACGGIPGGQSVRVVDPGNGKVCRSNRVGEIWLQGPSVCAGYWRRPQTTRESFGARLDGEPGTWLRTGDLGFMHQGRLYISGRQKDVVILRGRNYYPQDLEQTMERASSDFRLGCGAAFSVEHQGEERLVLVQETGRHPKVPLENLARTAAKAVAAEHEVRPLAVVLLKPGSVFKTSSGKIQRRACRQAYLDGRLEELARWQDTGSARQEEAGGQSGEEASVFQRCRSLLASLAGLSLEEWGRESAMASLGLDSLQAVEAQVALAAPLGFEPALSELYSEDPFEMVFSSWWERRQAGTAGPAKALETTAKLTLSPLQQSFAIASAAGNGNCWALLEMDWNGPLDPSGAMEALKNTMVRHESLGLRVDFEKGEWLQHVDSPPPVDLVFRDASELPSESKEQALSRLREEVCRKSFRPSEGKTSFFAVLKTGDGQFKIFAAMDHLVMDGAGLGVWIRSFGRALAGEKFASGDKYAQAMSAHLTWRQANRERDKAWWMSRWEEAPAFPGLPVGAAESEGTGFGNVSQFLDAELTLRLRNFAAAHRVSLTALLASAYAQIWAFWTRKPQVVVNLPVMNRRQESQREVLGCFADILPLRLDDCDQRPLETMAQQAQSQILAMLDHSAYSGVELARDLAAANGRRPRALSSVTFTSALFMDFGAPQGDPRLFVSDISSGAPETWVDCMVFEQEQGLRLSWNHWRPAVGRVFAQRLAFQFESALRVLLRAGERPDPMAALLTLEDQRSHHALNRDFQPFFKNAVLSDLVSAQARRRPDRVAVSDGDVELKYGQLDLLANRLARRLRRAGAGPGRLVGIHLHRTWKVPLAILAVHKAGAAYLPMDPVYPVERLEQMAGDSQICALITEKDLDGCMRVSCDTVRMEDEDWKGLDDGPLESGAKPTDLAYVIFTSGSTGKPKGMKIRHQEVVRLFSATRHWFHFDENDVWSVFHSYSFDFSVWEIFGALLHGGRAVMMKRELTRSPSETYERLRREGVTILNQTPSAFKALIQEDGRRDPHDRLRCLRRIIFGGEALEFATLKPWIRNHGDDQPELINMYGITETTVHVTYRRITREDVHNGGGSFIGRPIPDLALYVLDEKRRLLPVGMTGELYVAGAGLGEGYLFRDELTKERFVPNPFSARHGDRLYRTGDLARVLAGGELEYLGRADSQVQLRGFRIELGEIQSVLMDLPGIEQAAVVLREDRQGDPRLAAYLVGDQTEEGVLRKALARRLPDYMIPSHFKFIAALPLTPNGKLDQKSLPAPDAAEKPTAPAALGEPGSFETKVAGILAEALGRRQLALDEDFFEQGGHSLLAAKAASLLEERLRRRVSVSLIFEHSKPADLARRLEADLDGKDPGFPEATGSREGRLSFQQHSLWLAQTLRPESGEYNVPAGFLLRGHVDRHVVQRALRGLVDAHEALRTRYLPRDQGAVQSLGPVFDPDLVWDTPRVGSARGSWARGVRSCLTAWLARPFDLEEGRLLRARWFPLGPARGLLVLCLHHLAVDHGSLEILGADLSRRLLSMPPAARNRIRYLDFALWQGSHAQTERQRAHLEYWKQALHGAPELTEFPLDHPRREGLCPTATRRFEWPAALSVRLKQAARRWGTTPFVVMLAAYKSLLFRYGAGGDLCVGTPAVSRPGNSMDGVAGYFVNSLILRSRPAASTTFEEFVHSLRKVVIDALQHQEAPFDQVLSAIGHTRRPGQSPGFQSVFVVQPDSWSGEKGPAGSVRRIGLETAVAKYDLVLSVNPSESGLSGYLEYNQALYEAVSMQRLLDCLRTLLQSALEEPATPLSLLPLVGPRLMRTMFEDWNQTRVSGLPQGDLFTLFAQRAQRRPELTAVIDPYRGDETVSFGELKARSEVLAAALAEHGVVPGMRVGVWVRKSVDMVVATLAVLRAGATYVPMDPAYPGDRLRFMVKDAGMPMVLSHRDNAQMNEDLGVPVLDIHQLESEAKSGALSLADFQVDSRRGAYILYTSGSTGRPKGVEISHRSVVNLVSFTATQLRLQEGDTVAGLLSYCFDPSVQDIFLPLLTGARLMVVDSRAALEPADLCRHLRRHRATFMVGTPSVVELLAAEDAEVLKPIYKLIGGEIVTPEFAARVGAENGRLWNIYGPTETTIYSTWYHVQGGEEVLPIGTPIANTRIYLLDQNRNPVPPGAPGEIYIGGDGVGLGYLGRDDLNQERFLDDPFADGPGARMYKSGDQARHRYDGQLMFLGRNDGQVKLRGFRVELGEVEQALAGHPAVHRAVVALKKDQRGDSFLAAYIIPEAQRDLVPAELRHYLRPKLPPQAIPSAYLRVEDFPRNSNEKIDREALPQPGESDLVRVQQGRPPANGLERRLLKLWTKVLGIQIQSVTDHFFDMGGHSLSAVQLISMVEAEFGIRLRLDALFKAPTIEAMARLLNAPLAKRDAQDADLLVDLAQGKSEAPWFLVHPVGGNVFCYRALTTAMRSGAPVVGIQSPALIGMKSPETAEELAALYLKAVKARQPRGPYRLGGWSVGAVLAWEAASILLRQGEQVQDLLMIDPPWPQEIRRQEREDPGLRKALFDRDRAGIGQKAEVDPSTWSKLFGVFNLNFSAVAGYKPASLSCPVTVIGASQTGVEGSDLHRQSWGTLCRSRFQLVVLQGDHYSLVREPAVSKIASFLDRKPVAPEVRGTIGAVELRS